MLDIVQVRRHRIYCWLLLLCVVIVYLPVLNNSFIDQFDDYEYVIANPHIRHGLSPTSLRWAFTSAHSANWHPVTWLSHMMDVSLFGHNPAGHHLTNILVHVANTALIWTLLLLITGSSWRALFVAALFSLHPLHVESVAWVSERKDLLSTFFLLLGSIAYYHYTRQRRPLFYGALLLAFLLGLMCKPMIVTLPALFLLFDYWPLARIKRTPLVCKQNGVLILEKIPMLLLSCLSAGLTVWAQSSQGALASLASLNLWQRFANAVVAYVIYLWQAVWPTGLCAYYPMKQHGVVCATAAAALLVAITFLCIANRKNSPWLPVGWLWYIGTLIPVIGIVQVGEQAMADRYTYIPLVGIFVIVAWGFPQLTKRLPRRSRNIFHWAFSLAVMVPLALATYKQVSYWKDSTTLFGRALEVTEANHAAHYSLGLAYLEQERYTEALDQFRAAKAIKPSFAPASLNAGIASERLGLVEEAKSQYYTVVGLAHPESWKALTNLGTLYLRSNQVDSALWYQSRAVASKPDSWQVHYNSGCARYVAEQYDTALVHYTKSIELNPGFPGAYLKRAEIYQQMGENELAAMDHERVKQMKRADERKIPHAPQNTGLDLP